MASQEELRTVRKEKITKLQEQGRSVYLKDVPRTTTFKELIDNYEDNLPHYLAGRVMAIRGGGAIIFVELFDGTASFQVVFKKGTSPEDQMKDFSSFVDVGDFISCKGETFTTKRGAPSLIVQEWHMASKSLLPLPDKHAGLQDQDEIYRKRYLDMISNDGSYERFVTRSKIIAAIRTFFHNKSFIEIETPILQNQAGGAMAETFNTHHNDLDMDMVLRISLEIEHKMVMASGIPRIFEIGKNFRNEGSDPTHIQEFTMIEWYAAYESLEQNIAWTQELIVSLAQNVIGKETFTVWDDEGNEQEITIDTTPWRRARFDELLKEYASLDIHTASKDDISKKAQSLGMSSDDLQTSSQAKILDYIYKKTARKNLIAPTFVTNYPGALKPLALQNDDGTAQVAQLVIAGAEVTNQYAELIDPQIQRSLLEQQSQAKQDGDSEAMEINDRFITAMEHGMPPMTGFGMGIDRLVAILTEQQNLRDVILFPIMRDRD